MTEATPSPQRPGVDDDRLAPDDGIWVCGACGKTAVDRYGIGGPNSYGWDESCMLRAVLCKRDGIAPGERVTHAEPYITEIIG